MRAIAVVMIGGALSLGAATLERASADRNTSIAPPVEVAVVTAKDFRVVLSATRSSRGAAPTAKVVAAVFRRDAGRWIGTGRHVLPGTYFWHTITGPRAICRLELNTAITPAVARPRVTIQLLQSPSLGCARAHDYFLTRR
jgi:hypothetical protein